MIDFQAITKRACTPGKRVGVKRASGVRIPLSPHQNDDISPFFCNQNALRTSKEWGILGNFGEFWGNSCAN